MLSFEAPSTFVDVNFWEELYQQKLDVLRLSSDRIPLVGYASASDGHSQPFMLHKDSFGCAVSKSYAAPGSLLNVNTVNEFKDMDKKKLLGSVGAEIWRDMLSGNAIKHPELLGRFLCFTFADLKQYKFTYWFGFPALLPSSPYCLAKGCAPSAATAMVPALFDQLIQWKEMPLPAVFIACKTAEGYEAKSLEDGWAQRFHRDAYVITFDSSASPTEFTADTGCVLSWNVRNLLTLLSVHGSDPQSGSTTASSPVVQLVCIRGAGWSRMWKGEHPSLETGKEVWCLIGAGTLGCAVARTLLGWGIETITFVDSGKVSYSNPTRQCLFTYDDAVKGKLKATAAADALTAICPSLDTQGHVMTILMPGHGITPGTSEAEIAKRDYLKLRELVRAHDVVFALTDSREASDMNKMLINVALGFDSYLIMRHGCGVDADGISLKPDTPAVLPTPPPASRDAEVAASSESLPRLGCYFCQDIVAATNSQRDRTVDQQCTVTRPGCAMMAAGGAVELMVSMLHTQEYTEAPSSGDIRGCGRTAVGSVPHPAESSSSKGDVISEQTVPHQVRGSVQHFNHILPVSPNFSCCIACSPPIIGSFRRACDDTPADQGYAFVQDICNNPDQLEELSGIRHLTEDVDLDCCIDSDEEF